MVDAVKLNLPRSTAQALMELRAPQSADAIVLPKIPNRPDEFGEHASSIALTSNEIVVAVRDVRDRWARALGGDSLLALVSNIDKIYNAVGADPTVDLMLEEMVEPFRVKQHEQFLARSESARFKAQAALDHCLETLAPDREEVREFGKLVKACAELTELNKIYHALKCPKSQHATLKKMLTVAGEATN